MCCLRRDSLISCSLPKPLVETLSVVQSLGSHYWHQRQCKKYLTETQNTVTILYSYNTSKWSWIYYMHEGILKTKPHCMLWLLLPDRIETHCMLWLLLPDVTETHCMLWLLLPHVPEVQPQMFEISQPVHILICSQKPGNVLSSCLYLSLLFHHALWM